MNFRDLLAPVSILYGASINIRNKLFDLNILKAQNPQIFTVSIGNLSVGGTGKTQMSIYLTKAFKDLNPCILLRGYKRKTKENLVVKDGDAKIYGDEALEIYLKTKSNVVVAFKRIEGAKICRELGSNMIILDDGFSHRYIKRNVDILLMPANRLKDHLLPWGNLREPLSSIKRADAVVITRLETYPMPDIDFDKPIFKAKTVFKGFLDRSFNSIDISDVKGKTFDIVCALGDPNPFIRFVEKLSKDLGFNIDKKLIFKDHHFYTKNDLKPNKNYICTTKDLVKLRDFNEFIVGVDTDMEIPGIIEFIKSRYET